MGNFLQTIFDSLTGTAGVLIYNLLLAFSFASALQGSLVHWRGSFNNPANRQASGLFVLLVFQLALFTATGLGWTGAFNLSQVLPVADRVLIAFSLLWIIWLWAFPEPLRWVDALTLMLAVICIIAGLFSLSFWSAPDSTTPFNGSWLDQSWCIFALVLVLLGAAVLLIKHPDRWGTGLYIMAAMGVGLLFQLLAPPAVGDYSPAVRLAQVIAYPLLIILPQRFSNASPESSPAAETQPELEKPRYTTDPKTVNAFMELAAENDPLRLRMAILRATCQVMLADLALLVTTPTADGTVNIEGGFDLIREETLPRRDLPPNALPLLANALIKGRGVRLPYDHTTSPDMKNISEALGLANSGNLLAAPLGIRSQVPLGGILLLSPYSTRAWTSEEQAYLASITETMAGLLLRANKAADGQAANEQEHLELQTLRQQLIILRQQPPPPSQDVNALVALQKETQAELARLEEENEILRSQAPATQQINPESTQIENELRQTLKEMAHLQNSLASANIRIMELEKQPSGSSEPSRIDESISSLIQELRQAIISLTNQINLLANDEKGVQSRQIEKLKATAERLRAMVGDLIQAAQPATPSPALSLKQADPKQVVNEVAASFESLLHDKSIHLQIAIADHSPLIASDSLALRKIMQNLLHNAIMVSPPDAAVEITGRPQDDPSGQRFFLLQVKDSGGGISAADLDNLFSGMGPTEGQPVSGMSSSVDFNSIRSLVESQGGRLWVDTVPGKSSIFSLVLPLSPSVQPVEVSGGQSGEL